MNILTYSKNIKYRFVKTLMHEIKADIEKSKILDLTEQNYNMLLSKEFMFDKYSKVDLDQFYIAAANSLNSAIVKSRRLAKSKKHLIKRATPFPFDKRSNWNEDFISKLPAEYTLFDEDDLYKYISANKQICHIDDIPYMDQDVMDGHSLYIYTNNLITHVKNPLKWGCPFNPAELKDVELCDVLTFNNNLSEYRGSCFISFLIRKFTKDENLIEKANIAAKDTVIYTYKPTYELSRRFGYAPQSFNCIQTNDKIIEYISKVR